MFLILPSANDITSFDTIMIGDSYDSDILGAQNAGIDQIYFNPRIEDQEKDKPATYWVKNLSNIVAIL